jgi:hypothetical protein
VLAEKCEVQQDELTSACQDADRQPKFAGLTTGILGKSVLERSIYVNPRGARIAFASADKQIGGVFGQHKK